MTTQWSVLREVYGMSVVVNVLQQLLLDTMQQAQSGEQCKHTNRAVVVQVYGGLPPEARTAQALLFNTPRTGRNVLVASDAIGMGLNLGIR